MHYQQWFLAAVLLVSQASSSSAKSLSSRYRIRRSNSPDDQLVDQTSAFGENGLDTRNSPESLVENVNVKRQDGANDITTQTACSDAMSGMTSVSNPAGFAACYNILDWQASTGTFTADLRLFQISPSSGDQQAAALSDMTIVLDFPSSTQFQILPNTKRDLLSASVESRQETDGTTTTPVEIQHYSLSGSMKIPLDFSKLRQFQIMSLLVPQVQLQSPSQVFNLPTSDNKYFVAGLFGDTVQTGEAQAAVGPSTAAAAIALAEAFVLPGTSFGIFPTGLIVTGVWTLLFVLAYGFGTFCRVRERNIYRKKMEAMIGLKLARSGGGAAGIRSGYHRF